MPQPKSPLVEYLRVLLTFGLAFPFWVAALVSDVNQLPGKRGALRRRLPQLLRGLFSIVYLMIAYGFVCAATYTGPGPPLFSELEISLYLLVAVPASFSMFAALFWITGEIRSLHPNPPPNFSFTGLFLMFAFYLGVGYLQDAANEIPRDLGANEAQ